MVENDHTDHDHHHNKHDEVGFDHDRHHDVDYIREVDHVYHNHQLGKVVLEELAIEI